MRSKTDWTPFDSRIEFELADLLFTRMQTSNTCIDEIFDLWAADLLRNNRSPPFSDFKDLHYTIDSVREGDAPWYPFDVSYSGIRPSQNVPSWMNAKYEVWHRDPHRVVRDLLANTEFDGGFDYTPYQEFRNGQRIWTDLMSGNWAWKQAVRSIIIITIICTNLYLRI
jgi:hypothetical protein